MCGADLRVGAPEPQPTPAPVAAPPAAPAPVAAPPTPPAPIAVQPAAPAPVSLAEQVHAVIPNATLKAGFLGMKSKAYILVLTQRRVVFVRTTSAMMKQMVNDAHEGAKSEGKGFFGRWGAQITAYSAFAQRYLEMPPEQALAESPENFALERREEVQHRLGRRNRPGQTGACCRADDLDTDGVVARGRVCRAVVCLDCGDNVVEQLRGAVEAQHRAP